MVSGEYAERSTGIVSDRGAARGEGIIVRRLCLMSIRSAAVRVEDERPARCRRRILRRLP
jgi:hypothetical protein